MEDKQKPQAEDQASGADVDRIRDILFGGKMQDIDRRMSDLEKAFKSDLEKLRQSVNSRIEELEAFSRQELERMADKQVAVQKENKAALDQLHTELNQLENRLRADLDDVDVRGDQDRRAIREETLHQSHEYREELRALREELTEHTDAGMARLQQDKTGKEELSKLLQEFALRLSGEFQLPDE